MSDSAKASRTPRSVEKREQETPPKLVPAQHAPRPPSEGWLYLQMGSHFYARDKTTR